MVLLMVVLSPYLSVILGPGLWLDVSDLLSTGFVGGTHLVEPQWRREDLQAGLMGEPVTILPLTTAPTNARPERVARLTAKQETSKLVA
jgi:hypothetical protein